MILILFPVVTILLTYLILILLWTGADSNQLTNQEIGSVLMWLWIIIMGIWIVSFFFQKQLIFWFSWAKEITRKENPEIYNIVENLCISKGITSPKVGIIKDPSMNAFALWWKPEKSWIVFTTWLLEKLEKDEIEAVAAHELTHILNKDSLLMVLVVVYIWAILTVWGILIRSSRKAKKWALAVIILWSTFLALWYIFFPLFRLAISRKREFLADAGSVELTKNKEAMISALRKISWNPNVKINNSWVAAMCIESPKWAAKKTSWRSTHPSVDDRISALENY